MTVMNLTGSDLNEVWGNEYHSKNKKKRNAKKEEAEVKKPNDLDDIMDYYHPSIFGSYQKSRYSRTQQPLPETDAEEREDENKYINIRRNEEHYVPTPETTISPKTLLMLQEERERQYLDLGMYIFSGVALIFILEQFINLGVALK
jgi:hypothetical protein